MVICRFIARRDALWSSRAKGHRGHLREPAPRRDELRAGWVATSNTGRLALDRPIKKLARAGVDPMQVLAYEQDRLSRP